MSERLGGNAASAHGGARHGRPGIGGALVALAAVLGLASGALADPLVITGGPVYSLGGGSCSVSGTPSITSPNGATVSCTGVDLAAHTHVYFGIRNDTTANGQTMTGAQPTGPAVFGLSATTSSAIVYTSTTTVNNLLGSATQAVNNRLTLTLASGSATVVPTGGNPADNGNGAIGALFEIGSGDFSVTVDLDANAPGVIASFGQSNPNVFDPIHTPSTGASDVSHVDLAFYFSDCGDGVPDSPEECDLGLNNGQSTTCCTSSCQFRSAGLICRTAVDVCDAADTCTGADADCPSDGKSTSLCRASVGTCDSAEFCDGVNDNCPSDAKSTGVCRAAGGACDIAESCDGVSNNCPADAKSTAECRAAAGVCDVAESCDGVNNACPTDAFVSGSTECRASGGVCDVAENCTGSSALCPPDAKSTAECRGSAGACDLAEQCDGVADDCPADAKSTAECRAAAGACDAAETCDGIGDDCPSDIPESAGTECRAAAGICDVAEQCDGVSNDCPADALASGGTECRAAADVCDVAEQCTGSSVDCPPDDFEPDTVVCRAATSGEACDVAETCTGSSAACPPDIGLPNGTSCDDSTFCNGVQTCTDYVCGGGSDPCGLGLSCDEATDSCFIGDCPPNAVACRPADKTKILIKNKSDDAKDKVVWKWTRGAETTQGEFADPTVGAQYALCFYAGTSSALLKQIGVPPSASKWSVVGTKGFKYKDKAGTADGVTRIVLKGGIVGRAKAIVKGKGEMLPDFDGDLPIGMGDLPLIVQLRNNENGICWEGEFMVPKKNEADQFKAKNP